MCMQLFSLCLAPTDNSCWSLASAGDSSWSLLESYFGFATFRRVNFSET